MTQIEASPEPVEKVPAEKVPAEKVPAEKVAVEKVAAEKVKAVDLETVDVLTVLHALSDPVRLEIVRQLAGCAGSSELKCGQVEIPVTKSTASHHFKTLYEAGIVSSREQGTSKYIRLRRAELDQRFPGLFDSVLRAVAA